VKKNALLYIFSVIFLISLISDNVFAQYYLGAKVSWSMPNLSGGDNPLSEGFTLRSVFNFGILGSYDLNNNWALQVEANYASQGGKKEGFQAFPNTMYNASYTYLYANFNQKVILNYIEVPLLAKYTFKLPDNTYKIYVDFGPYVGYLLNAETKDNGNSTVFVDKYGAKVLSVPNPMNPNTKITVTQTFNNDSSITNYIHRFNFGVTGGVGFEKTIGFGDLFIDIRGSYGLINIQKYPADGKNNTDAFVISLGLAVKLD
jgi:hypothetical protein